MFGQEVCSGRCKGIVRKIVEHVRAETEQWSQMQGMLGQVRDEMEELQASRDFWEDRALESDDRLQTLQSEVCCSPHLVIVVMFSSFPPSCECRKIWYHMFVKALFVTYGSGLGWANSVLIVNLITLCLQIIGYLKQ